MEKFDFPLCVIVTSTVAATILTDTMSSPIPENFCDEFLGDFVDMSDTVVALLEAD
jgi:hypothetical protein